MDFDPSQYGTLANDLLCAAGWPEFRMPLVIGECTSPDVRARLTHKKAKDIFPKAAHPDAALSGLYLYIACFEESHSIAQDIKDVNGSYWHAILHRQEPDAGNAGYWFHKVGTHAIFADLAREAELLRYPIKGKWDPIAFVSYCADSDNKKLAKEVQNVEWQLLFHHCARPK